MDIIKSSFVALIATLFCIWLLKPLAKQIGFVDRPGGRKHHSAAVPLIGGVAMFFGFCFALLALNISLHSYRGLIAGSALLILMGVVDDFKDLSSHLRLFGQLLAAVLLTVWGGQQLVHLGDLFFLGPVNLGLWAFPVTVFVVVAYLNAMNMIDGQDGLAGGVALGQTAMLLALSLVLGKMDDARFLIVVAVLLLVFLNFNMPTPWRKKASIFMGDSGVTFIGFLLAWFAINLSQSNVDILRPITVLWIMAFPLFDLVNVCLHRLRQRKSMFLAGRDHLHHILHMHGLNAPLSTLLLCLFSLLLGGIGLFLDYLNISDGWQLMLLVVMLIAYTLMVHIVRDKAYDSGQAA